MVRRRLSSSRFEIGSDPDAMPGVVVDRDLLHLRLDALQRELRAHAVGIGEVLVRAGLKHIGAAAGFGHGANVGPHVLLLLRAPPPRISAACRRRRSSGRSLPPRRHRAPSVSGGCRPLRGFFLSALAAAGQRRVGPMILDIHQAGDGEPEAEPAHADPTHPEKPAGSGRLRFGLLSRATWSRPYMVSGADTPSRRRPLRITTCAASARLTRASRSAASSTRNWCAL